MCPHKERAYSQFRSSNVKKKLPYRERLMNLEVFYLLLVVFHISCLAKQDKVTSDLLENKGWKLGHYKVKTFRNCL